MILDVEATTAILIGAVPRGRSLVGDAAYDSDGLRRFLFERGTTPLDWRRIATRYDKLATNFAAAAAVALADVIIWWT